MLSFARILTRRATWLASAALALIGLALPAIQPAMAQDATWLLNPGTGDYNTDANWSTATVPTGTAFFDTSTTTALSISGATSVGGWTFNAGALNYSFSNNTIFNFTGAGIDIQGGSASITNNTFLIFWNSSTAGSAGITNNGGL